MYKILKVVINQDPSVTHFVAWDGILVSRSII